MTKTEAHIIDKVRNANDHGALASLGTNPEHADFHNRDNRFIKKLYEAKALVYISVQGLGQGWAISGREDIGGCSMGVTDPKAELRGILQALEILTKNACRDLDRLGNLDDEDIDYLAQSLRTKAERLEALKTSVELT